MSLLPPSKFDLEKEAVIAEKRLAKVFQEMVNTKESKDEGGLRSCLRPLSEAASLSGNQGVSLALTLLYQISNIIAHQGLANLPFFLAVLSRIAQGIKDEPALMLYDRGKLDRLDSQKETQARRELEITFLKIERFLAWDFPLLASPPPASTPLTPPPSLPAADQQDENSDAIVNTSSADLRAKKADSDPNTCGGISTSTSSWKDLGESMAKVSIS